MGMGMGMSGGKTWREKGRGEQVVSFEWGQDKASWQWDRHLVMQHNVAKARIC